VDTPTSSTQIGPAEAIDVPMPMFAVVVPEIAPVASVAVEVWVSVAVAESPW